MGHEFVQVNTFEEAENEMPGAAKIIEVDGGFIGFKTITDYEIWENQN